ncbi:A24 family peptidase [Pasteurella dagmatis]|uniref:Peptidase, A24 family n=1 Tax=Pasteurella dagmatis ATCC 43325 TaxID=667128 RepID=C9PRM0_9PAST|nr:prepilin peptidase [Pasteurella dagmatis]EEX49597.1 peptidase, A24 family [Pasteurella dagmatis ATCC 43325]SNV68832.1 Flp pilus assembly protein, protease CpaA [Pasteurella dagmatis]
MNGFIILSLQLLTILLLIRLSYTDIKHRIISNKIVLILLLVILPLSWIKYGEIFVVPALISFIIGFILFNLKTVGAGDVKLVSVLMLAIPQEQIMSFFFFTACSGLILIIIGWIFFRESILKNHLPYGVAISLGFLLNLLLFS